MNDCGSRIDFKIRHETQMRGHPSERHEHFKILLT